MAENPLRKHDVIIRSETGKYYKLSQDQIERLGEIKNKEVEKKTRAEVGRFLGALTELKSLEDGPYFVLNCPMFREPRWVLDMEGVRFPRRCLYPPEHRSGLDVEAPSSPAPPEHGFVIITVPRELKVHGQKAKGGHVCKLDLKVFEKKEYVWKPQPGTPQGLLKRDIDAACNSGATLGLLPDVFNKGFDPSVAVCFVINCESFQQPP